MKKIIAFLLTAIIAVTLFGCNKNDGDLGKQTTVNKENGYTLVQEVKTFKFSEEEESLKTMDGVRVDGFKVPAKEELEPIKTKSDVLEIALQEVTVQYNTVTIYFDRTRGYWKVDFTDTEEITNKKGEVTDRKSTPKETVYIDEDGYTFLCVTH